MLGSRSAFFQSPGRESVCLHLWIANALFSDDGLSIALPRKGQFALQSGFMCHRNRSTFNRRDARKPAPTYRHDRTSTTHGCFQPPRREKASSHWQGLAGFLRGFEFFQSPRRENIYYTVITAGLQLLAVNFQSLRRENVYYTATSPPLSLPTSAFNRQDAKMFITLRKPRLHLSKICAFNRWGHKMSDLSIAKTRASLFLRNKESYAGCIGHYFQSPDAREPVCTKLFSCVLIRHCVFQSPQRESACLHPA
jgi:hypothetical protein